MHITTTTRRMTADAIAADELWIARARVLLTDAADCTQTFARSAALMGLP
jgi:hypothetical protein